MRGKSRTIIMNSALVAVWAVAWSGCSTATVNPMPPLPPDPPPYVRVPHPEGSDLGDVMAIFVNEQAPAQSALEGCDVTYRKLKDSTQIREELDQGLREMVKNDPVGLHWCFYGKLLGLEEQIKRDNFVDERQKRVIDTYQFLTPLARAYLEVYNDSRYLRMAVARYQRLSEFIFYRRVELTHEGAAEIGPIDSAFGTYRPPRAPEGSILKKYNLLPGKEAEVQISVEPPPRAAAQERVPASEAVQESFKDDELDAPANEN